MLLDYLGKQKAENCVFSLKRWIICQQTQKNTFKTQTHYYHLVTAKSHFICTRITVCTKQKLGRENSMLPSVTAHLPFAKSVMMSFVCQKWEWLLSSLEYKFNGQYWWDILLSQQNVSCYQTHYRRLLFAFQQHSSRMHQRMMGARNSSGCAKLNFISLDLWLQPQQDRAELNWLKDLGSTAAWTGIAKS